MCVLSKLTLHFRTKIEYRRVSLLRMHGVKRSRTTQQRSNSGVKSISLLIYSIVLNFDTKRASLLLNGYSITRVIPNVIL
jgi:hypothetical protein